MFSILYQDQTVNEANKICVYKSAAHIVVCEYLARLLNLANNGLSDVPYRRSWSRSTTCEHIDTSTSASGRRAPRTSDETDLPESARAHQTLRNSDGGARVNPFEYFFRRHENGSAWATDASVCFLALDAYSLNFCYALEFSHCLVSLTVGISMIIN